MAAGPSVGYATLQIIPSARGFAQAISGEIRGPMSSASQDAGEESGEGFMGGFAGKAALMAAAAGVAVGAAFVAGIGEAMDQERAGDRLAAQLGLSPQQQEAFGRAAGELYVNAYGESIGEVYDALGAVESSFSDAALGPWDDALSDITAKALDFAAAFEIEVARAVSSAGTLVSSGLARDAEHAFDLMVAGMQEMPAHLREELLEATDEYGTFFAGLGISAEETFGILVSAADDGIYGIDKTGDALKELTIRATDMSALSIDAYEAAGLSAEDMAERFLTGGETARGAFDDLIDGLLSIEDPVERANAAIGLFGTPLEDLQVSEIPGFLESLGNMETSLGDVSGAAEDMGTILNDNVATKIETFKRTLQQNFVDFLGESVIPKIEALVDLVQDEGFAGAIGVLADRWVAEWPRIQLLLQEGRDALVAWIKESGPPMLQQLGEWMDTFATWLIEVGAPRLQEATVALGDAFMAWLEQPETVDRLLAGAGKLLLALTVWIGVDLQNAIRKATANLVWAMIGWTADLWKLAFEKVEEFRKSISDWVDDIAVPMLYDKGKSMGAALLQGLADTAGDIIIDSGLAPHNWLDDGIPGFASGGIVPGPLGAPRLVLAHAGETILPTHRPMSPLPSAWVGDGAGAGGDTNNYYLNGIGLDEVAERVRREQRRKELLTAGGWG